MKEIFDFVSLLILEGVSGYAKLRLFEDLEKTT
jgi:hypothetical protein